MPRAPWGRSDVNLPEVVAELTVLYERYETALVAYDVPGLPALF